MAAGTSGPMDIQSGLQQQITTDHGDQNVPTWSHDGDWIYFSWRQGHTPDVWQRDIWRVRVGSGRRSRSHAAAAGTWATSRPTGRTLLYQPALAHLSSDGAATSRRAAKRRSSPA